jgi:hypothetical protein
MYLTLYYRLKPLIPRRLQIVVRGAVARRKRERSAHIWPIDERSAAPPSGWAGWPEGKSFALVLTHDVETAEGQAKCRALAELEMRLGFRSSFNFVAEDYPIDGGLQQFLLENGFEIGVHGLNHKGNLFGSFRRFLGDSPRINHYLRKWGAAGFRAPSMYHNLEWTHLLDVRYDSSTFDTDPFEPQPHGLRSIFPVWIDGHSLSGGYVELPYTLPQDYTLFVLLREPDERVWRQKVQWIAAKGGMALGLTHTDYMAFKGELVDTTNYPVDHYMAFLSFMRKEFGGQYWHALPREVAEFWSSTYGPKCGA